MAFIMSWREGGNGAGQQMARLAGFRDGLYCSLGMRRDALFEICDALACRPERVHMLAELCLEPECRRGHGGVYDAVNSGEIVIGRLRRAVGAVPLRRWDDGRIRLACDVSNWLRPDAETSPERLFCHVYARGKGNAQMIPGWPYSWIAVLEPGRTSWTLPLDAVRLGPEDDATQVTAAQVRDAVARLMAAGHWKPGDPDITIVLDAGYDLTRLAWLLADLPADVTGRLRSDRVMYFPAPPLPARPASTGGRRPRHGHKLAFAEPASWPEPAVTTVTDTARYGAATAMAWPSAAPAAGAPRQLRRPRRRAPRRLRYPHPARRGPPARIRNQVRGGDPVRGMSGRSLRALAVHKHAGVAAACSAVVGSPAVQGSAVNRAPGRRSGRLGTPGIFRLKRPGWLLCPFAEDAGPSGPPARPSNAK